jgi:hypothetical protein
MVHHWQSIVYPVQGVRGIGSPQSPALCRLRPPSKLQRILNRFPGRSCSSNQFTQYCGCSQWISIDRILLADASTLDLLKPSIVAHSQSMSIVVCYCVRKCLSSNSIGLKMNFQAITKNSFEKGIQRLLGLTIVAKVDRHSAKFKRIP